jgi:hypothetical protein
MQTTYTELSLESNEALSLASMVRQSCSTARLLGAKRIQNRKLWREYGSGGLLRLASLASSLRGVCAWHKWACDAATCTVGKMCGSRAMVARRTRGCFSMARAR